MMPVIIDTPTGTGQSGRLTALSSFEFYELADMLAALAVDLPDLAIRIERMPTGLLTERLLTELRVPTADLVLGLADTAARTPGLAALARRFSPVGDGLIRPTGFSTAFVIDPNLLRTVGMPGVRGWRDLADSRLQGLIAFPDPSVSGAGYLALTTVIQRFGEPDGFALLEAIQHNVAERPPSAWMPAEMTGNGCIAIGITVRIAAVHRLKTDPRLLLCEPIDGTGAEAEVYGVLAGSHQPDAAKRVIDWLGTASARALFDRYQKLDMNALPPDLIAINAARAVAERSRHLARYAEMIRP